MAAQTRAFGEQTGAGRIVGAPAVGANLARLHQLLQRLAHLSRPLQIVVADVELIEVEVVGLQPPQTRLARAADIRRAGIAADRLARIFVEALPELGGDDDLLPPSNQRLAEDPLAVPRAVDVGGVEQRDAEIERPVDRAHRLRVIHVAPADGLAVAPRRPADGPTSHAQAAHRDAGTAQGSCDRCFHV